ncbi:cytidylate kinase-like family protein [Desulfonema magnum]|uniref:Cytidylate kinase-like family protein n=1 Tax=Desulfonema magnum TaxID=45655 RepID=A0A975BRZ4_9BACT|nr:cytidylate kinase-like family protein [Desulfonema magnum]QTA89980.1 Cytidylate kinase-like family protein [Desulfonema magnum]
MAVITIAREFGAGGKTLGTKVADKLGYTLIDEEIVEMVAKEANVSPDWVDSIAKETGSEGFLPRLIKKIGPYRKGYVGIAMEKNPGYIDGDLYISILHNIIPKIASQDNVIIIGRGGQYILSDHPNTYHFLMIAKLEHRITFMMENYNLNRKQAQIVVDKQDKRRLNLYRYFAKTDYNHPKLYHMVFNMDKVRMEEAVNTVVQLASGVSAS